jgi:porphyrinogen peroxidase
MSEQMFDDLRSLSQPGILAPPPAIGRSLCFRLAPSSDHGLGLRALRDGFPPELGVIGIGNPTMYALGARMPGLSVFPQLDTPAGAIPSTQQALWVFLRGENRGDLFDATAHVERLVEGAFLLDDAIDTFTYAGGRDLTGYEDGTENPRKDAAVAAAFVTSDSGIAGSSFVAVQRWVHNLRQFKAFTGEQRDAIMGRRLSDNAEIGDAPASAHVKRAAQESFAPAAFMLRRSMPWSTGMDQGLEFIAYGASLDRFERVLRRMAGLDDGITDGLFTFSRPLNGGYYWCPPVLGGRLDLRALDQ